MFHIQLWCCRRWRCKEMVHFLLPFFFLFVISWWGRIDIPNQIGWCNYWIIRWWDNVWSSGGCGWWWIMFLCCYFPAKIKHCNVRNQYGVKYNTLYLIHTYLVTLSSLTSLSGVGITHDSCTTSLCPSPLLDQSTNVDDAVWCCSPSSSSSSFISKARRSRRCSRSGASAAAAKIVQLLLPGDRAKKKEWKINSLVMTVRLRMVGIIIIIKKSLWVLFKM